MKSLSLRLVTCLACVLLLLATKPASARTSEAKIKAAMLYHFAMFIEWPARAFPDEASPFVVCLLGEDSIKPWLQEKMTNLRIGAHPTEIRQLESADQARDCHLLYISPSEQPHLQQIFTRLRNMSVLTVSDIEGFCAKGGMIDLLMQENQMSFDMNAEAAEAAGLKIDSALKRIARTIDCGQRH